jgi:RNA polymerase sigma factor (sigma-70 family)
MVLKRTFIMKLTNKTDEELVISSFNKDTAAFEEIVKRYQSLVCSVAYNAIGDLGLSEDLAQETFIIAWKKLSDLKNPAKLRSWLCAIIRNVVHNYIRKEKRQPTSQAIPIADGFQTVSAKQSPNQEAISREEEAILWSSLERIPDKFREPMVLFYREDNSIRKVADLLELSEDVVRQRLFRGRALLREEMALFVENTLKRSRPQKRFTIGVMTSLPAVSPKAIITTATSVVGVVKTASGAGLFGSFFGFLGAIFGVWCDFKSAKTVSERKFVILGSGIGFGCIIFFLVLFFHIPALAAAWHLNYLDLLGGWIGLFIGCIICWQRWYINKRTRLQHEGNGACYPKQDIPILVEKEWRQKTGKDLLNPQLRFFFQTASLVILIGGLISIWILFQYGILDLSFINSPF